MLQSIRTSPSIVRASPARPKHSQPRGASFTISVPAGWSSIVTAISRKPYMQAIEVAYDIMGRETRVFGGKPGKTNDHMRTVDENHASVPFVAQDDPYVLELNFFFSATEKSDAEKLVDTNAKSNRISVLKTAKIPGSFDGPETATFIVFVEDTPTQEAGTGHYDDAIATVHMVQMT